MPRIHPTPSVEELQGIYGPYQVSELVLQKIWLDGSFDSRKLVDSLGRSISIRFPGTWNRLSGPDFKDAVLVINGEVVEGDVEIHFSLKDWSGHCHDTNPEFDRVILHVLFHPVLVGESSVETSSGIEVPSVSLMERLWYDLEEYANIDSILTSTGMELGETTESLLSLNLEERREVLISAAKERWFAKVGFASLRINKLGWVEACHQSAMEILGYRFNRAPMLQIAGANPYEMFAQGRVTFNGLWDSAANKWKQQGCRPANLPQTRLLQYLNWVHAVPEWPDKLMNCADVLKVTEVDAPYDVAQLRRILGIKECKSWIDEQVVDGQVGGTRLDTLVCDGFLPLLGAVMNVEFFPVWFSWYLGDLPDRYVETLKLLQIAGDRKQPMSNGWGQGIFKKNTDDAIAENSLSIG